MTLLLLLLYFLLIHETCANDDALSQQVYRFVFAHEEICGDPFVNPDWLPAIGDCVIGCEERRFICLMHTENKQQKCQSLPRLCVSALAREFDWPDEERAVDANVEQFQTDMLQLGLGSVGEVSERYAEKTAKQPEAKRILDGIIESGYGENSIYEPSFPESGIITAPPETTTETTTILITTGTTTSSTSATTSTAYPWTSKTEASTQEPVAEAVGYEYPIQMRSDNGYEAESSRYPTSEVTRSSLLSPIKIDTTKAFSLEYSPSFFTLKVKSSKFGETTQMPVATSDNYDYSSTGSRIDLFPPPPPPDPVAMDSVDERYLSRMIKQFSVASPNKISKKDDSAGLKDRSRRCCEWALNGLCDRTWQKVRVMCPKSCGVISCEDVDGIMSCNRIPDVDVEECYQSVKKKARVFAAKVFVPGTTKRKLRTTVQPSTVVIKSTSRKHKKKKRSKKHRQL